MSPGQRDETVVGAEVVADGDQTRLVLEERGLLLDEFAAHEAGWQAYVEDLAAHVEGRERVDWRTRWSQLTPLIASRPMLSRHRDWRRRV